MLLIVLLHCDFLFMLITHSRRYSHFLAGRWGNKAGSDSLIFKSSLSLKKIKTENILPIMNSHVVVVRNFTFKISIQPNLSYK